MHTACVPFVLVSNNYCNMTEIGKHLKVSWLVPFLNANPRNTFTVAGYFNDFFVLTTTRNCLQCPKVN